MAINEEMEEVKVEKGMGIWGNTNCAQCGACCYEWNQYLHKIEAKEKEICENFLIKDGQAYCLAHEKDREPICQNYFCGNTDFIWRFRYHGDEKLRKIAETLGTVPPKHKIPSLLPPLHSIEKA
jgi:hypothetical protein